jgi:hypothetical protein
MLAHKVAQHHGLQTSTTDYEASQCRVIAHRSAALRNGEAKVGCMQARVSVNHAHCCSYITPCFFCLPCVVIKPAAGVTLHTRSHG